ncbi:MAG: hypothetical protein R3F11_03190 [Verrucomicrobiales bacterium]
MTPALTSDGDASAAGFQMHAVPGDRDPNESGFQGLLKVTLLREPVIGQYTNAGGQTLLLTGAPETVEIPVAVTPGFANVLDTTPLDEGAFEVASVQHRLNYFGYRGADGEILTADGAAGSAGSNTRNAFAVFNASLSGSIPFDDATSRLNPNINNPAAPRWGDIAAGLETDTFVIVPADSTEFTPTERYGTNWAADILRQVEEDTANGDIPVWGVSLPQGGSLDELHPGEDFSYHVGGLHIDIDTPGDLFLRLHDDGAGGFLIAASTPADSDGDSRVISTIREDSLAVEIFDFDAANGSFTISLDSVLADLDPLAASEAAYIAITLPNTSVVVAELDLLFDLPEIGNPYVIEAFVDSADTLSQLALSQMAGLDQAADWEIFYAEDIAGTLENAETWDSVLLDDYSFMRGITHLIADNVAAGYDFRDVEDIVEAFHAVNADRDESIQPTVASLYSADPRAWNLMGGSFVLQDAAHAGQIQVNILPPKSTASFTAEERDVLRRGIESRMNFFRQIDDNAAFNLEIAGAGSLRDNLGLDNRFDAVNGAAVGALSDPNAAAIMTLRQGNGALALLQSGEEILATAQDIQEQIEAAVDAVTATVNYFRTLEEVGFTIDYATSIPLGALPLDFGVDLSEFGMSFDAEATIEIAIDLAFSVSFGVDLTDGSIDDSDFFLALDSFYVGISATEAGTLNLGAQIAILEVGIQGGSFSLGAGIFVDLGRTSGDDLDAAGGIGNAMNIDFRGSLDINLPVSATLGGVDLGEGGDPRITIRDADLFDATLPVVSTQDLDELLNFKALNFADIISILNELTDFLIETANFGFLAQDIPLLGFSISDAVDFVDEFAQLVDGLATGESTIQELEEKIETTLGLAYDHPDVTLTYDPALDTILIDITIRPVDPVIIDENLELSLAELLGFADGGSDTAGIVDLEEFIGIEGEGNLQGEAAMVINLGFGIDLSVPDVPEFFIQDDTNIELTLEVYASDLEFTAFVGPVEFSVEGGSITIDDDGDPGTLSPALFAIGLAPNGGRYSISELGVDDLDITLTAGIDVTLPTFAFGQPIGTPPDNELIIQIDDLAALFRGDLGSVFIQAPDLKSFVDSFDFSLSLDNIVFWLDSLLALIQDALDGQVWGINLPFVGDKMAEEIEFIQTVRDYLADLDQLGEKTAAAIRAEIFNILEPVGILLDWNGDGDVNADDVDLTIGADGVEFNLLIGQTLDPQDLDFDFDLGIPGFGLEIDTGLEMEFGWQFRFGFGVDRDHGFYLKTDITGGGTHGNPNAGGNELYAYANISLKEPEDGGEVLSGSLLFLSVDITDNGSYFDGTFAIDLTDPNDDGYLTWAEMQSSPSFASLVDVTLDIEAAIDLHMVVGIAGGVGDYLPSIETDFELLWNFDPTDGLQGDTPTVSFNNVALNLSGFVSQFIAPILGTVQDILEPVKPVIDVLNTRVPVLSDVSFLTELFDSNNDGDVTLLELAPLKPETKQFLSAVIEIADIVLNIPTQLSAAGDLIIPLGSFDLNGLLSGVHSSTFSLSDLELGDANKNLEPNILDQLAACPACRRPPTSSTNSPSKKSMRIRARRRTSCSSRCSPTRRSPSTCCSASRSISSSSTCRRWR